MGRTTKGRRALNAWAKGPEEPSYDFGDLYYWATYVERRAKVVAFLGYLLVIAVAAGLPYWLWGVVAQRAIVALFAVTYWPVVWHFYMRKHFKPQYRRPGE